MTSTRHFEANRSSACRVAHDSVRTSGMTSAMKAMVGTAKPVRENTGPSSGPHRTSGYDTPSTRPGGSVVVDACAPPGRIHRLRIGSGWGDEGGGDAAGLLGGAGCALLPGQEDVVQRAGEGERERFGVGAGRDSAELLLGVKVGGEGCLDVVERGGRSPGCLLDAGHEGGPGQYQSSGGECAGLEHC